ncbi:MAG: hypothetical protein F2566_03190 [Actinobacteria bacterium]|nr:hypothetical protein [Actinomycetota bacterium]
MSNSEMYRPRSSYFFAAAIYILCAGIAGQSFYTEGAQGVATTFAWCLFVAYAAHLGFVRPKVTFFDEGITITNPLKEITVGWGEIEDISARYSMYIQVAGEKIYAWAAQAPGRYHSRTVHASEIRGLKIPDLQNMRPGESPRTHSGQALALARIRFDAFQSSTTRGTCDNRTEFNQNGLTALITLFVIACALSIF